MKRIDSAAKLIKTNFIDIGTDHGELIVMALKNNENLKAIGIDVNQGPLENAKKNIQAKNLQSRASLILSNGITKLSTKELIEFETLVLMGLGGNLINQIIRESIVKKQFKKIIVQANNNTFNVLREMEKNKYKIIKTIFVKEKGIIYIINEFEKVKKNPSENNLIYEEKQYDLCLEYFESEKNHLLKVKTKIPPTEKTKIEIVEQKIQKIENEIKKIIKI